jgi:hypothetical protein
VTYSITTMSLCSDALPRDDRGTSLAALCCEIIVLGLWGEA